MIRIFQKNSGYFLSLILMLLLAIWLKSVNIETDWQEAGWTNFCLGFTLLSAHIFARILKAFKFPLISGYIFAGIIAGPYVSGFLTQGMVQTLSLANDLALSFIAFTAGGELHLNTIQTRIKSIGYNIILQPIIIFLGIFLFIILSGRFFTFTRSLPSENMIGLAILLGVIAVARSPSSAIAIISECKAKGPFTDTVLGVTVAMDVLIIVLFTVALTVTRIIMGTSGVLIHQAFAALSIEIMASFIIGILLGKGISLYIEKIGHDLALFLVFLAFGVTKTSLWLSNFMDHTLHIHLSFEPLLICMSAGFTVQNFTKSGEYFMENLERMSLPIYVLFFTLAGAALNLDALRSCWTLAVCLVFVRVAGIFGASWAAGAINGDPPLHNRNAWLAYLTQAGVAIGLAQLVQRQYPEVGMYLTTLVLAVISLNQVVGPITFKMALGRVGEAKKE